MSDPGQGKTLSDMEELKPLDQIALPDQRNLWFGLTLERVHSLAASIELNDSVPNDIRSHFVQAQSLAIYAWFHYQFHVTAEFMSMVTIEYALREKFKPGANVTLKKLVSRAAREGLIKDEGFAVARNRPSEGREKSYVDTLVEVLPDLRNGHAHGSSVIYPGSLTSLRIAADFINQLFPPSDQP